jgi:hypothetical protein
VFHAHGGGILLAGCLVGALLAALYTATCVTFCKRKREWPLLLLHVVLLGVAFYVVQGWCRMFDLLSLMLLTAPVLLSFLVALVVLLGARVLSGQTAARYATPRAFVTGAVVAAALGIVLSVGRPLERCRFGYSMTNGVCVSAEMFTYFASGSVDKIIRSRGMMIDTKNDAQLCLIEYVSMDDPPMVQYQVGRLERRKIYFERFHPVYAILFSDAPDRFPADFPARDAAIAASASAYPDTWDRKSAILLKISEQSVQWPPPVK